MFTFNVEFDAESIQKKFDESLHKFWTQNQKKYGIKYSSNYAQFKEG